MGNLRFYDPSKFRVRFYDDAGQETEAVELADFDEERAPDGKVIVLNGRAFAVYVEDLGHVDAFTTLASPVPESAESGGGLTGIVPHLEVE